MVEWLGRKGMKGDGRMGRSGGEGRRVAMTRMEVQV